MKSPIFFYNFAKGWYHYHKSKNYQLAAEGYEAALKSAPNDAKTMYKAGISNFKCARYEKAVKLMSKALELKPQMQHKWGLDLKWARDKVGNNQTSPIWWQEAERLEKLIEKCGGNENLHYKLGNAYLELRNYEKSLFNYEKALEFSKVASPLKLYRIGFVRKKLGLDYLEFYVRAHEIASDESSEFKSTEIAKYGVGVFSDKFGFMREAVEEYEEFGKTHKVNEWFYFRVAKCLMKLAEFSMAKEALLNALEINFTSPTLHFLLGECYEKLGELKNAATSFENAVKRDSSYRQIWVKRLVGVLNKLDMYKEAAYWISRISGEYKAKESESFDVAKFLKNKDNLNSVFGIFAQSFPIDEKAVMYESFHGRKANCNPWAIFLETLMDERFAEFTHIWVVNDSENFPDEYKNMKNLILVPRLSKMYYFYLNTSKYLINNATFHYDYTRRKGQFYLNTWHGTPMKTLGKDITTTFLELANTQRNFLQATHMLSQNTHTSFVLSNRYDIESIMTAKILQGGYPRTDLTLNLSEDKKAKLKEQLGLNKNDKIILYAPTFRGEFGKVKDTLNIKKLTNDLSILNEATQKAGYKFVFQGHYTFQETLKKANLDFIQPEEDMDTNEILAITDILISDYSSIVFDFMLTEKPIIYYTYDYDEYKKTRGQMYFEVEELAWKRTDTLDEVTALFTDEEFLSGKESIKHRKELKERFCPFDDGRAAKRAVEFFFFDNYDERQIYQCKNDKKNILFFAGPLIPNGITTSFINLVNSIDRQKYNIFVVLQLNDISPFPERKEQFEKIKDKILVLPRVGATALSLDEKALYDEINANKVANLNDYKRDVLKRVYEREIRRLFGESKFDIAFCFENYSHLFVRLFSFMESKKLLVLHNDMENELKVRFPNLENVFKSYARFDKLLSVSGAVNEINRANLVKYGIDATKFGILRNTINEKDILERSNLEADEPSVLANAKGKKIFVNVARLSVEKDQKKLIEAFAKVHEKFKKTQLWIVGDGPLMDSLKEQVKRLGLKKDVLLLGRKSNPFAYVKAADCFVLSSVYEGQGLALFESLMLEKYTISTNVPSCVEVLDGGKFGKVCENSVEGLVGAMEEFLTAPLSFVKFDAKSYQKEVMEAFEKVLDEKC